MYIGRIVAVAQTIDGRLAALYRVSSRSFPNRTATLGAERVSIIPKPGYESDIHKNPYIAYNCVRIVCGGEVAVVTNGSQTDPIAEKMQQGMGARDALTLTHLAMDYEKDQYNTPRISAIVDKVDGSGWLAIVREDGLEVRRMPLTNGQYFYLATYEENMISEDQGGTFECDDVDEACGFMLGGGVFAHRTHPVTAVVALAAEDGFEMQALDTAPGN